MDASKTDGAQAGPVLAAGLLQWVQLRRHSYGQAQEG